MLSLVMYRDMNRSEQENLYRTSRKLSLVPLGQTAPESRRPSAIREDIAYRNEGAFRRHSYIKEDFTPILTDCSPLAKEDLNRDAKPENPLAQAYPEDLVLSVLKSPVNHASYEVRESRCGGFSSSDEMGGNNEQEEDR